MSFLAVIEEIAKGFFEFFWTAKERAPEFAVVSRFCRRLRSELGMSRAAADPRAAKSSESLLSVSSWCWGPGRAALRPTRLTASASVAPLRTPRHLHFDWEARLAL